MMANDADLVEINPLAIVRSTAPDGTTETLQCLDAKVTIDDSALARHPDLEAMRDLDEEDPVDVQAREQGLSFIKLDGTIGCMVNGAGLAMTTMDLIKRAGGEPANFLDVGGGAKADKVAAAMRLILADDERPRHPGQHLRRHRPRRRSGARPGRGTLDAVAPRADGRAHRRHQRGPGRADPGRGRRSRPADGRVARRGGREGRRGRNGAAGGSRMSILVNSDTRLIVQGITGREGMFHAQQMQDYGTNVVGGMTPGKGGQTVLTRPVPVFDTCAEAVPRDRRQHLVHLRPGGRRPGRDPRSGGRRHQDGLLHHRAHPGARHAQGRTTSSTRRARAWSAPTAPARRRPGQAKVGIIPGNIHRAGHVGVVSRSGTLTYEVVEALTEAGIGQSTCVGIGGDPINGSNFIDILTLFRDDPDTHAVVLIGEIGGDAEERAADWIAQNMHGKPMARSSPAAPRRPGGAWATPARSSAAAAARPRARSRRSRPPASAWPTRPARSRSCSWRPEFVPADRQHETAKTSTELGLCSRRHNAIYHTR